MYLIPAVVGGGAGQNISRKRRIVYETLFVADQQNGMKVLIARPQGKYTEALNKNILPIQTVVYAIGGVRLSEDSCGGDLLGTTEGYLGLQT